LTSPESIVLKNTPEEDRKMRKFALGLVASVFALMMVTKASADLDQFAGRWKNTDPNTRGVTTLDIGVSQTNVTVQAWGKCHPKDCDWGRVQGFAYGPSVSANLAQTAQVISAVFQTAFSQTLMVIRSLGKTRLQAEVLTRFTDQSGRTNYRGLYTFRQAAEVRAPFREDCIPFDYIKAAVRNIGGRWKIVIDSMWLKDFGNSQREARQALRIIKHYRMNKQCFVGRPDPSMEYYLVNDRAPTGALSGEDCISFNPANIAVSNIGGRWKIVDGSHWIMDFGAKADEARAAFRIIKNYGFNRICFVGRPNPSMTYFRR
jgi:hypothetical protein